ncbi:MAG: hypothetical protein KBT69_03350 [Oceanihabitans sp.]|nr:hypothetical protein [Oceanihabitans sp.]
MTILEKNNEIKNTYSIGVPKAATKIATCLMLLLITTVIQGQTTTTSSSKSSTTSSTHSDSDADNSSYSYSHSSNDKNNNVSVSISNSDDSYSFKAKFPSEKHQEIKAILTLEMSSKNHTPSKGKDTWNSDSNEEEVYKVSLSSTKLSMYLDKEIASSSLAEKMETLGITIRTVIVGEQNEIKRDAERLQREADRLGRDAERMQREADRIQHEAQKQAATTSRQYRDDALRIAEEARRLADEASGLNIEAAHKGSINAVVKQLLEDAKTTYKETTKNSFNWTWPDAQKELLLAFKKDDFIDTENAIVFVKDKTGMHVNGKHISKSQVSKYHGILAKHGISSTHYFTFYKTDQHIVLVNDNANLNGFIDALVSKKIIASTSEKVKLEWNGDTAYLNGNEISTDTLSTLNTVLLQNKIIPAPGKIFEIMKPGNYKLGYSLGKNSHLGTWQMRN